MKTKRFLLFRPEEYLVSWYRSTLTITLVVMVNIYRNHNLARPVWVLHMGLVRLLPKGCGPSIDFVLYCYYCHSTMTMCTVWASALITHKHFPRETITRSKPIGLQQAIRLRTTITYWTAAAPTLIPHTHSSEEDQGKQHKANLLPYKWTTIACWTTGTSMFISHKHESKAGNHERENKIRKKLFCTRSSHLVSGMTLRLPSHNVQHELKRWSLKNITP